SYLGKSRLLGNRRRRWSACVFRCWILLAVLQELVTHAVGQSLITRFEYVLRNSNCGPAFLTVRLLHENAHFGGSAGARVENSNLEVGQLNRAQGLEELVQGFV